MKILNLYAGIGGNRKLWGSSHDITAVESDHNIAKAYQKYFPSDKVIIGDAHEYLLLHAHEFDFIWASPPCPTHSRMNRSGRNRTNRYPDMRLYQEIIFLKHYFKGKFVVENVIPYYEALIKPHVVDRHCFWSNFIVTPKTIKKPVGLFSAKKEVILAWLGIEYSGDNIYVGENHDPGQIFRNCVHPELGEHVFNCAFKDRQEKLGEG